MVALTEPITAPQVRQLLDIARRERDAMTWVGAWTALGAGLVGAVACLVVAELFHRRYEGEYRQVRREVERQMSGGD